MDIKKIILLPTGVFLSCLIIFSCTPKRVVSAKIDTPNIVEPTPAIDDLEVPDHLADAITAETLKQFADLAQKIGVDKEITDGWRAERELYVGIDGSTMPLPPNVEKKIRERVADSTPLLQKLSKRSNEIIEKLRKSREIPYLDDKSFGQKHRLSAPIYFDFNSCLVQDQNSMRRIKQIAEIITKFGYPVVLVLEGHADPIGSDEINFDIGRERAKNVASLLNQAGLPFKYISIETYGETRLIVPDAGGDDPEAYKNRRVAFGLKYR